MCKVQTGRQIVRRHEAIRVQVGFTRLDAQICNVDRTVRRTSAHDCAGGDYRVVVEVTKRGSAKVCEYNAVNVQSAANRSVYNVGVKNCSGRCRQLTDTFERFGLDFCILVEQHFHVTRALVHRAQNVLRRVVVVNVDGSVDVVGRDEHGRVPPARVGPVVHVNDLGSRDARDNVFVVAAETPGKHQGVAFKPLIHDSLLSLGFGFLLSDCTPHGDF